MVRVLTHYVDGSPTEGTSGRFSDVFDPSTGQVQARVPLASQDEVRDSSNGLP
jgi:malonate-semialdehyde dehydrogenase (acetylating)/methylmalonate-semialdehyde dehydrogenase